MDKTQYILRSLTKIRHKRWETFIISRILHRLDDREIEFVTQQLVRRPDGRVALTDLFFPQFNIHLEIKEPFHENTKAADVKREQDIVTVTGHTIEDIVIPENWSEPEALDQICHEADAFADIIRQKKADRIAHGSFSPWDQEAKYSSERIIARGYVDVADNVVFRLQVDALKCFGFTGKVLQKGVWTIPDGTGRTVWFPRLYRHYIWENEMTPDGTCIFQRALDGAGRRHNAGQIAGNAVPGDMITFAKARDPLGANVLRYVGTFRQNNEASTEEAIQLDRVRTREPVRPAEPAR